MQRYARVLVDFRIWEIAEFFSGILKKVHFVIVVVVFPGLNPEG